jgi:hypothetical protein
MLAATPRRSRSNKLSGMSRQPADGTFVSPARAPPRHMRPTWRIRPVGHPAWVPGRRAGGPPRHPGRGVAPHAAAGEGAGRRAARGRRARVPGAHRPPPSLRWATSAPTHSTTSASTQMRRGGVRAHTEAEAAQSPPRAGRRPVPPPRSWAVGWSASEHVFQFSQDLGT